MRIVGLNRLIYNLICDPDILSAIYVKKSRILFMKYSFGYLISNIVK